MKLNTEYIMYSSLFDRIYIVMITKGSFLWLDNIKTIYYENTVDWETKTWYEVDYENDVRLGLL